MDRFATQTQRRQPSGRPRGGRRLAVAVTLSLAACSGMRPAVESPPPPGVDETPNQWLGRYDAMSEWDLAIVLADDGSALIETTWWGASGPNPRQVRASWSRQGDDLHLRYGQVEDRFSVDRARPDGGGDARPRLTALEPIHPRSLVGLSQLWLEGPAR